MKIKQLINMLESHNINANIIFIINKNNSGVIISSTVTCKCKEKDIYLTIGTKEIL